jgi:hypothetical protein
VDAPGRLLTATEAKVEEPTIAERALCETTAVVDRVGASDIAAEVAWTTRGDNSVVAVDCKEAEACLRTSATADKADRPWRLA